MIITHYFTQLTKEEQTEIMNMTETGVSPLDIIATLMSQGTL